MSGLRTILITFSSVGGNEVTELFDHQYLCAMFYSMDPNYFCITCTMNPDYVKCVVRAQENRCMELSRKASSVPLTSSYAHKEPEQEPSSQKGMTWAEMAFLLAFIQDDMNESGVVKPTADTYKRAAEMCHCSVEHARRIWQEYLSLSARYEAEMEEPKAKRQRRSGTF